MSDVPESFWDNLLDSIQEGTVVPVVGSELVTVREGEQDVPLDRWLARRLAADLDLPTAELPQGFALNEVVSLHLRLRGEREREELYPRINRTLRNAALTPPKPLLDLASIPGFDLFVSLTFDSLLADAISAARSGGARVDQVAYSPRSVRDLAGPKAALQQPVVFHLLGQASPSPNFAICDEDLLEFVYGLQDKQRQPKTLLDELRANHLLILGCSFGDWLVRFFLRTARGHELSQKRWRWDFLIGDHIARDAGLAFFLKSFSSETHVIPLTAAELATELARRWHASHPAMPPRAQTVTPGKTVPAGAAFISYAREDFDSANRLAEGLSAAGLDVWFDKKAIDLGDDWSRSIRRGIRDCSLFIPVISHQSVITADPRRYFWKEWMEADNLASGFRPDEHFIVPIAIDDTRIDHPQLPDSFLKAQARSLQGGTVPPEVAERLLELVRDFHRRRKAA